MKKAAAHSNLSRAEIPTMLVVRGVVHFEIGGHRTTLNGQTLKYNRHGSFRAEYVGDSYAVIDHQTVNGQRIKVFIPPKRRINISNGRWITYSVNYRSFRHEAHPVTA